MKKRELKKIGRILFNLLDVVGFLLTIVGSVLATTGLYLWARILIIFGILIFLSLVALVLYIISEKNESKIDKGYLGDKSLIVRENLRYVENLYSSKEYNDVCLFGDSFSRMFYIGGAYKSRIAVAKLVALSAQKIDLQKICAKSLLDMAWTYILLGDRETISFEFNQRVLQSSLDILQESEKIAIAIDDKTLLAKINSHISGYYVAMGEYNEAEKYRLIAVDYVNQLPKGEKKNILLALLEYNFSETCFCRQQYEDALKYCESASKLRIKEEDNEREVRYFAQKGKILYKMGDKKAANKLFVDGYTRAKKVKRLDEILKNAYGQALCLLESGQRSEAILLVRHTIKEYGDIPLYVSDHFFINEYNRLIKVSQEEQ